MNPYLSFLILILVCCFNVLLLTRWRGQSSEELAVVRSDRDRLLATVSSQHQQLRVARDAQALMVSDVLWSGRVRVIPPPVPPAPGFLGSAAELDDPLRAVTMARIAQECERVRVGFDRSLCFDPCCPACFPAPALVGAS
jgi:hypothetical protein